MSVSTDTENAAAATGIRKRIPSEFLGKQFAQASRMVIASNAWMKAIPTRNCDVLVTFPAKTEDSTLMWVLSRLKSRTPEISVHVRHHANTGVYGFYLTAAFDHLLRGADDLAMKKQLKDEFGRGMKEFTYGDKDYFLHCEDEEAFFTSQERQSIVQHMLYNLRAETAEQLGKVKFIEGQAIVPLLESKRIISQVLPLHNNDDLTVLRKTWVQAFFRWQPLDKICDYFGVKIAMYFAYLGHYTAALYIPAFVGLGVWFTQGKSQLVDDLSFVGFALFNVLWATLYLENWKRNNAELAFKWGTLDKKDELLEDPRPLFKGYLIESAVTGRQEPYYPAWKRNLFRYLVSIPIMCLCLSVIFVVMLLIFQLQEWINILIKEEHVPNFTKFVPKILLALSIGILDDIYKKIARWLNDKENYRMEETYENHLIIKLVLFQFVNSFLSLFYIAFYLRDMTRLREQLAALLITKQVIGNIKEALLPWVVWKVKLFKAGYKLNKDSLAAGAVKKNEDVTGDSALRNGNNTQTGDTTENLSEFQRETKIAYSGKNMTQAEIESAMKAYEDTFEDYLEMVIQFGYVTLFSPAFPMAAMCALLNNVIEIRSDAFKLCVTFQRPFGQRVESIGTWQDVLELLGTVAVIVNCCLVAVFGHTQRLYPGLDSTSVIVLIVVLEHIILSMKFGIAYAIPDIPQGVATEMARLEFLRRDAFKKLESKNQPATHKPVNPVVRDGGEPGNHSNQSPSPNNHKVIECRPNEDHAARMYTDQLEAESSSAVTSASVNSLRNIPESSTPNISSNQNRKSPHATTPTAAPVAPPRLHESNLSDPEVVSAISYLKSGSVQSSSMANPVFKQYKSSSASVVHRKIVSTSQSSKELKPSTRPTLTPHFK